MFAKLSGFFHFAGLLVVDAILRPGKVISEIATLSIDRCLKFGWLCFFFATLVTAGYQYILTGQVLGQITTDPDSLSHVTSLLGSLGAAPVGDLKERLEIVRLSSYASLLLSPLSAWFFLYLLSGALFMFAKVMSFGQSSQDAYEQVMKIVAVGQAPLLLCILPLFGPIIGNLWSMWFIARGIGTLFQINILARVSIVGFSFLFLFSIWNSTISILATAYHQDLQSQTSKNTAQIESNKLSSDMI